jgi:hypothetical protein
LITAVVALAGVSLLVGAVLLLLKLSG